MRLFLAVLGLALFSVSAYACDTCGCKDKKPAAGCAAAGACKGGCQKGKGGGCPMMKMMSKLDLTEEQKAKIAPIMEETRKKVMAVLTEKQRKAMEAMCAAKGACGSKGACRMNMKAKGKGCCSKDPAKGCCGAK